MYTRETEIRVRYAETDQMGYVYYGNYPAYFEVGRVESLRSLGMTYKALEASGVMMPVLDCYMKYIKPAKYDDVVQIRTIVPELPGIRMKFLYELSVDDHLIHKGETTLVFVDMKTLKPRPAPEAMLEKLRPFFKS